MKTDRMRLEMLRHGCAVVCSARQEMSIWKPFIATLASLAAALCICVTVQAQTVTGTLGSPSATTTVPSTQLPPPDPAFGGVIKYDALQSKPCCAPHTRGVERGLCA
jgi:hypothetical protein